jgi:hypothetical protein
VQFTINIQPGAVQINQDSRELPAVLATLQELLATIAALKAKVDTLVPDQAQLDDMVRRVRESTDRQQAAIDANTPQDGGS